jgi:ribosomal protein L37AE/L43A
MARNQVQFQKGISLPEFLKHYGQEKQCQIAMTKLRWPDGFICPECGHPGHCKISRGLYQCNRCRRQQVASFSEDTSWVSPMLIEDAYKMLELRALIKALDDTMEALCEASEIGRLLKTIPGFGKTSCAELAGEIDDIRRFESEASLAMYLGMAPLDNASGVYRGSKTSKQINRRAKKAMMTAVDRHRANVTESQVFYDKKRKQGYLQNVD